MVLNEKLTKGFEDEFKKLGVTFKIECPDSPKNKCEEDWNGLCYYCRRPMLED